MNNTIYITGHRHPDSDAICSAIAAADLFRQLGYDTVPVRQGPANDETKFILDRFHQERPLLLTDARMQIRDIDIDKPTVISENETVHHAWHVMLQTQNRSLFCVDQDNRISGICTTSNLSYYRLQKDGDLNQLMSTATLENIAKTIDGTIAVKPKNYHFNGVMHIITLEGEESQIFDLKDGLCMLSSDPEKQKLVIKQGAAIMLITCGVKVKPEVLELAEENDCAVIETELDTMHCARIAPESYCVKEVMSRNIISFKDTEYVEDVAVKMTKSRVRSYPVLDEDGRIVGAISRYHTQNYPRRKMILVDHSATNQSIGHVESADIQAIIDHHHIGDIQTLTPIMYRNQKVGCTSTVLVDLYKENGLLPDADISGLMMSAILSDTLNFKSATTTKKDKLAVAWLAKRAGVENIDEYAKEMLGASVSLQHSSMHEILTRDMKEYTIKNHRFSISQTNFSRIEDVQKILPEFKENMQKELKERKLDLMVMLFTDVLGSGSLFVFYGALSSVVQSVIETQFDEHSGFDRYIISRKQQLMPKLSEIITNMQ